MNETWRKSAHQKINQIASSVAEAMGGSAIVYIKEGYPSLTNSTTIANSAFKIAENFLGIDNVQELEVRMTAEDFAYFTNEIPGLLYRLGTRNEKKGITHYLHTSTFDVDEKAIETGMGFMSFLAIEMLKN
jgi:metal-dependent amidase/aminoacylase/carboxypeptidase family protein